MDKDIQALLGKLNDVPGLQEKIKGAADLDAALAIAKEAGFDITKAEYLEYKRMELSDEDLEKVAGGFLDFGNQQCSGFSKLF